MNRVNAILAHPAFRALLAQIEEAEQSRPFCGHGMEHLLSVARLMALTALQEGSDLPSPLLYAAALVHDLGRAAEYAQGIDHQEAGVPLAAPILADCGFSPEEVADICAAIPQHRSGWAGARTPLGALLFRADKESRPCFACPAAQDCNWPEEKKNLTLLR